MLNAAREWFGYGSVAVLADTIRKVGDAINAIRLRVTFMLARRKPSPTFTCGLGLFIVAITLLSALVACYQSINRLINLQPISDLGCHSTWLNPKATASTDPVRKQT